MDLYSGVEREVVPMKTEQKKKVKNLHTHDKRSVAGNIGHLQCFHI